MTVGALEILLVLFVAILIIVPSRIVDLGSSICSCVRDFKLEFVSYKENTELGGGEGPDAEPKRSLRKDPS